MVMISLMWSGDLCVVIFSPEKPTVGGSERTKV